MAPVNLVDSVVGLIATKVTGLEAEWFGIEMFYRQRYVFPCDN